jgi:multiple sugar transport system ATP-binding protein
MGRAIVRTPKVFLMDEPLSNLDVKLRVQLREELTNLHARLNTTVVYVTHDQAEAMSLGMRIVVMNNGVIQQVDTPKNVYMKPSNTFVAEFIGIPAMNLFEAIISQDATEASLLGHLFRVNSEVCRQLLKMGYARKTVIVGIRPEDISVISHAHVNDEPAVKSKLINAEYNGAESFFHMRVGQHKLCVRVIEKTLFSKDEILLSFNVDKLHFFDSRTKTRII